MIDSKYIIVEEAHRVGEPSYDFIKIKIMCNGVRYSGLLTIDQVKK